MEVLDLAGKFLRNTSPVKIENRNEEAYYRPYELILGYSDCGIGDLCSITKNKYKTLFLWATTN